MTVVLSLLTAFAWTAFNYWLVPITRTRRPVHGVARHARSANGLFTIPLALALDGVPGRGDLRPLGCAVLAGVFEVGGFLLFFRALAARRPRRRRSDHRHRGRHHGARRDRVRRAHQRAHRRSGSRSRSQAAASPAAQGRRRTAAGALPAAGAAVCFGLMFALYAAAEDLGPVSAVAAGRLSALTLLGAIVALARRQPPGTWPCAAPARPGRGRCRCVRRLFVRRLARAR